MSEQEKQLGSWATPDGCAFRVWAPDRRRVELVLFDESGLNERLSLPMTAEADGWFSLQTAEATTASLYKFRVDGEGPWPDPASRSQPLGVHGPSEVRDPHFRWSDHRWRGRPLQELVIYEVHVGTATPEGTFDGLVGKLDHIRSLGATAIELMPVASFPGRWNWGYDGVDLFAPAAVYGGPDGLMRLIDAAHGAGLAVIMDVVYNHFGPAGNYLRMFARRYFTDRHTTPWGEAINFDGEDAGPVREFFLSNAEMWIRDFHADGLRLDAVHAICDDGQPHVLREIGERARAAAPHRHVIVTAEDERNDVKLLRPPGNGGLGLDAVWADDFHHHLRRAFAGDREGYFADFSGSPQDIATTLRDGWFYQGQQSPRLGRPRGTSTKGVPLPGFIQCIQNHDQVGNRAFGDRLGASVDAAAHRAASALLLLSPATPLLFMGQEWNASTPFLYFTDHEPDLGRLVTEGRRAEFKAFADFQGEEIPDPQAEETFARSRLDWSEPERPAHASMLEWYRSLLTLRQNHPAMRDRSAASVDARACGSDAVLLERRTGESRLLLVVNLRGNLSWRPDEAARWKMVLHSDQERFGGAAKIRFVDGELRIDGAGAAVFEA